MKLKTRVVILAFCTFVAFKSQANDISGIWSSNDYQCPSGTFHNERFRIEKIGTVFVAVKLSGDSCVPTGAVTFFWDTNSNICRFVLGTLTVPASTLSSQCTINVIDSQNIAVDGISFTKENSLPAATAEAGTVSSDLDIHMPSLDYKTLLGTENIWIDLKYTRLNAEGKHSWELKNFGVNQ